MSVIGRLLVLVVLVFSLDKTENNEDVDSNFTFKMHVVSDKCTDSVESNDYKSTFKLHVAMSSDMEINIMWHRVFAQDPYSLLKIVSEIRSNASDVIILDFKSNLSSAFLDILANSSTEVLATDKFTLVHNHTFLEEYLETCPPQPPRPVECKVPPFTISTQCMLGRSFLSRTTCSLLTHLSWKETLIIYEKDFELEVSLIEAELSASHIRSMLLVLDQTDSEQTTGSIRSHVETIVKNGGNITLLCRHYCNFAINKDYISSRNPYLEASIHLTSWLIIHIDDVTPTLNTSKVRFDNVAILSLPNAILHNSADVYQSLEEMVYSSIIQTEKSPSSSISSTPDMTSWKKEVVDSLRQEFAALASPCTWYPIRTLMWVPRTGFPTVEQRGLSSVGRVRLSGELDLHSSIFPNREFGFNGREFIVSMLEWSPFVSKTNGTFSGGVCIDILEQLRYIMNFTYRIVEPADGQWGQRLANGSFTGLIGLIERHEVDILAAPLTVTYHREEVLDFIYPFFNEVSRLLQRKPDENDRKWRKLIDPFHPYVLLCLGISLPVAALLMSLFEKVFPQYRDTPDRSDDDGLHTFSNAFWYLYGALLTQGGEHMAESITGRLFLSSWWIFSITIMGVYSGNLIAFLTVSKETVDFHSLKELVTLDDYKWGFTGGTAWMDLLDVSLIEDHVKFWSGVKKFNKTDPSVLDMDPSSHIAKVLEGNYAFLADDTFLKQYITTICDLAVAEEALFPSQYAFALRNNSMFVKAFSRQMIEIHESGLLEHWKHKESHIFTNCEKKIFQENTPIELLDVQSAFYLIAIGIFVAVWSFVIECCKHKYAVQKKKREITERTLQGTRRFRTESVEIENHHRDCFNQNNNHEWTYSDSRTKDLNVKTEPKTYFKHTNGLFSSDVLY